MTLCEHWWQREGSEQASGDSELYGYANTFQGGSRRLHEAYAREDDVRIGSKMITFKAGQQQEPASRDSCRAEKKIPESSRGESGR